MLKQNMQGEGNSPAPKPRNTNLELLRIIAMLTIIAHHYVVNSGITDCFDYNRITSNMVFLQLWGMWGKTAINAFVMITGYFICKSQLTVKRIAKVYLETKFYTIVIFVIFLAYNYEQITARSMFKLIFGNLYYIGGGFTASFLAFYLFIPFYNKLLTSLGKKEHLKFIALLLVIYTGASTFFFCNTVFSEPVWYMVLYFVAAYIRLYGKGTWMENNKIIAPVLIALIIIACLSVIVVDYIGTRMDFKNWSYMVADSNKLFAFMIGAGTFLLFNNLNMKYSRTINTIAASTFGVLCIHANSDVMRYWLWKEVLNVSSMYKANLGRLVLHASVSMLSIFAICIIIDMVRIKMVERPVIKFLDRYYWFHSTLW